MADKEVRGNKETASVNTWASGCNTSVTYFFFFFFPGIMAEEILRRDLKGENEVKCVDVCPQVILNFSSSNK